MINKENIKYYHDKYSFNGFYREIFLTRLYEKYFEVQENYTVVDVGANVGLFTLSIIEKLIKKCYVIEPDINDFFDLKLNLSNYIDKIVFINEAIGYENKLAYLTSNRIVDEKTGEQLIITRNFRNLLNVYKIDKIDFLKLDAEFGEHSIITNENKDILKNINFIAAEIHVSINNILPTNGPNPWADKIFETIDTLEEIFDVIYTSTNGIIIENIKQKLNYYEIFMVYAINKNLKNCLIIEYKNGIAKVTSELLDNPCNILFENLDNNQIEYNVKINSNEWAQVTVTANKWKVHVNNYNVIVCEAQPIKYIKF